MKKYYDKGYFIVSGPRIPREKGGVIVMEASIRGRVDQIMREDPFIQNGVASYEMIPFEATRYHEGLADLIDKNKESPIEVVPYNPEWPMLFEEIVQELKEILGDNLVEIHHIGSTSVPGLDAKPVIDVIPVVKDVETIDALNLLFESKGYEVKGELGMISRRFFVKNDKDGGRVANIHTWPYGSPQIERHLIFRDYLRSHPEVAEEYANLKKKLAKEYPYTREGYTGGKEDWIASIVEKARQELKR